MLFKLCVFLTICFVQGESSCPLGFIGYRDSCYHFSSDTEDFPGSEEVCRLLGAHLVEINDADENNFVTSKCRSIGESCWIGLSDLRVVGTYFWVNSKKGLTSTGYSNWYPGQPDHDDDTENCVNLEDTFNWSWNDLACHVNQNYVCEMPNGAMEVVG